MERRARPFGTARQCRIEIWAEFLSVVDLM
jgi:hypothetical protein